MRKGGQGVCCAHNKEGVVCLGKEDVVHLRKEGVVHLSKEDVVHTAGSALFCKFQAN